MAGVTIALIAVVVSAAASAGAILLLLPLLRRYALARPNARSSHSTPTPQGGGIAVIAATLAVTACVLVGFRPMGGEVVAFGLLATATILVALVGAVDDLWTLGIAPRLALQALAAGLMLAALPSELRVAAGLPWWLERALMLIAALWFINFTNFMDGLDWMMVAEVVPVTVGLILIALIGELPQQAAVVALALCGAILGFAPFNRPVARLFLGDVGSLPIGLMLAWLLVTLAGQGHLVAALLLPFYFASDATITLASRIRAGERAWEAHRGHFYQRATAGGFTVREVVARVFAVNTILATLAIVTVRFGSVAVQLAALVAGIVLVGGLLWSFARGKS
jgi:UDP-N-acetylmuramyl pentapeptide phosphotransferase/UDP-N-acetylglucosamine-1-phosphate transferase